MHVLTHPHRLIAAGAFGIALTTSAEILTAPYSDHVIFFGLNPAVHAVKVIAALIFIAGFLALAVSARTALGRLGAAAASALAIGTAMAAIPYSVLEARLGTDLTPVQAATRLDESFDQESAWIGHLASVGLPLTLLGLVTLAVVVWRGRLLPTWRPLLSLSSIPVAILAGVLAEMASLPVPHPPAWIFAGLGIAYSRELAQTRTSAPPTARPRHRTISSMT